MEKLFIEDLPIKGKKTLMRVDFNVPLDGDGNVVDATRIEAALPSIKYILNQGGAVILMSHLGRPKYAPTPDLSLKPVAKVLSQIMEMPIKMSPNCIGSHVSKMVQELQMGEVMLLENLRFHRAEEHPEEDPSFAQELSTYGELYVNDAFGTAHRKHSSTYEIAKYFPGRAAAGYLLEKEVRYLGNILEKPKHPFDAILGGAKISSKIGVIRSLLDKVDHLLIGGAMAYTFLKAFGYNIGDSLVEDEFLPLAKEIYNDKILLPIDIIIAKECSNDAQAKLVDIKDGIPAGYQGLDIGPKTIENYSQVLNNSKTILWNGPLGVYEFERFAKGTRTIAQHINSLSATSVVGGGDLVAALNEMEGLNNISHISTGGGATLEFIEKGTLPGVEILSNKKEILKN